MGILKGGTDMKTCPEVIEAIASGLPRDAETEHHIAECPDCALFLRMSALENTGGAEVPAHLDAAILAEARRHAAHRTFRLWKIALPIAASFAVAFGLAFYSLMPSVPEKTDAPAVVAQTPSLFDYDDSLIALSCDVADGAQLLSCADEFTNQGVQTI